MAARKKAKIIVLLLKNLDNGYSAVGEEKGFRMFGLLNGNFVISENPGASCRFWLFLSKLGSALGTLAELVFWCTINELSFSAMYATFLIPFFLV